jgi:hypothetical protein
MFDRTACPDPGPLAARPHVSIEALAALCALPGPALKDQTPSAVLLSGPPVCIERLNASVLVMKSTKDIVRTYDTDALNLARDRRILV